MKQMLRHCLLPCRIALGIGALLLVACQPMLVPSDSTQPDGTSSPMNELDAGVRQAVESVTDADTQPVSGIAFEAIDVACRDGNIVLSDSPYLAGTSTVDITQADDAQDFDVLAIFSPEAYPDSSWVVPGRGIETPDGIAEVYHRGEGTGDFAGSRIAFFVTTDVDPASLPCDPVGPVVKLEGAIISDSLDGADALIREYVTFDYWCKDGNIVVGEEPLAKGRSDVEVNPDPDHNFMTVDVTHYPDAYPDASWIAPGRGVNTEDGGFVVIHHGYGTGALDGAKTYSLVTPVTDLAELPCELDGPVVKSEGIYVLPMTMQ